MVVIVLGETERHRVDKNQLGVGRGEFRVDFLEKVTLELKKSE